MDKRLRTSSFANEDFELTNGISPSNIALVFAGGSPGVKINSAP